MVFQLLLNSGGMWLSSIQAYKKFTIIMNCAGLITAHVYMSMKMFTRKYKYV